MSSLIIKINQIFQKNIKINNNSIKYLKKFIILQNIKFKSKIEVN